MRAIALFSFVILLAACSSADTPPAADTSAVVSEAPPAALSLATMTGMWDTNVRRQGTDSIVATNVVNATDSTAWTFAFPNRAPIAMRITGTSGDTVMWETDAFESAVKKGLMTRNSGKSWIRDGKMMGSVTARYETTGPDTVIVFDTEGTKR